MQVEAFKCDCCGRVNESEAYFFVRLPGLDLHFCDESERDRYIKEAPPGERAAVLEDLAFTAAEEGREQP